MDLVSPEMSVSVRRGAPQKHAEANHSEHLGLLNTLAGNKFLGAQGQIFFVQMLNRPRGQPRPHRPWAAWDLPSRAERSGIFFRAAFWLLGPPIRGISLLPGAFFPISFQKLSAYN